MHTVRGGGGGGGGGGREGLGKGRVRCTPCTRRLSVQGSNCTGRSRVVIVHLGPG